MAVRPTWPAVLPRLLPPSGGARRGLAFPGPAAILAALRTSASHARGRHLLVLDCVAVVACAYVALTIRYDHLVEPTTLLTFLPAILFLVPLRAVVNICLGLYSRRWQFASVPELAQIVYAITAGSLVAVFAYYGSAFVRGADWAPGFPRSFWLAEAFLTTAAVGGLRVGIRALTDTATPRSTTSPLRPTLLYGAGYSGVRLARSAQHEPEAGILPVGFLDDDPTLKGTVVAGIRVWGGLTILRHAVASTGATSVLITMPSAPGRAVRRVVDAALALGLEVRTVPSLQDIVDGSIDAYHVRHVRLEDLLRRPAVSEHAPAVRDIVTDQCVMVTGAGGSIGSELARQLHALRPRTLVLVDRAESPMYTIQRELQARAERGHGGGAVHVHLGNVVSRDAMGRLVEEEAPDVIFHAAAYKHVPLMEDHPSDAAYVNMAGTLSLLDAAVAADVGRFVFVSTDKAVRPSSVMGASKRIAEMLVADTARLTGRPYVAVRFGNVLGSSGSVVPIFQDQLERGEPLTVTHPDMTRFFMTIPEAAWLILDAAALGRSGDLFVLDMGEPIRILDLAHDLVRLAGRDPESQPIEIVGLRPGEKLHEELFYAGEQIEPTSSEKVLRVLAAPPPAGIRDDVQHLLDLANAGCDGHLRTLLVRYAQNPAETAATLAHSDALWQVDRTPADGGGTDVTSREVVGIGQTA